MIKNETDPKQETHFNSSEDLLSSVKKGVIENNILSAENQITVVKRNGAIVPFRKERIARALKAAFCDTNKVESESSLTEEALLTIDEITKQVVNQAIELAHKNISLTVEGIQDLVEVMLMKNGLHDVARDYIIYRDHHKAKRSDDPQNLKIFRGETSVRFNPIKISSSVEKIFRRLNKIEKATPQNIIEIVNVITQKVVEKTVILAKTIETLHVYHIQNLIEEVLMQEGYFHAAKEYILYRAAKGEQTQIEIPSKIKKKKKRKEK